jgi:hypothetical protein
LNIALLVEQKQKYPGLSWEQHGLLHGCTAVEACMAWLEATEAVTRNSPYFCRRPAWHADAHAMAAHGWRHCEIARAMGRPSRTVSKALRRMLCGRPPAGPWGRMRGADGRFTVENVSASGGMLEAQQ